MAGFGEPASVSAALRRRLSPPGPVANSGAVFHGNHMMVAMALGFLFMSGGLRSFGGSCAATAALVISLFPRFPVAPTDNRWHLQARSHCLLQGGGGGGGCCRHMHMRTPALVTLHLHPLLVAAANDWRHLQARPLCWKLH